MLVKPIIWVDDEIFGILRSFRRLLEDDGFTFECFEDAASALEFIRSRPDLRATHAGAIVDAILPRNGSYEALRQSVGLELIEHFVSANLRTVLVCTVMTEAEISPSIAALRTRYPNCQIQHLSKLELMRRDCTGLFLEAFGGGA